MSGSPQTRQSVFGLGGAARESLEEHAAGRLLNLKGKRQRREEERIVQPRRGTTAAGAVQRDAEMYCTGSMLVLFSFLFFPPSYISLLLSFKKGFMVLTYKRQCK